VSIGYTPEQIKEMGNQLFPQLMHHEDLANLPAHMERLQRAKDGEIVEWEYRMRHANGQYCWIWSRDIVFKRTSDGLAQQILGTAQDISDRYLAQQEREKLLQRERAAKEEAETSNRIKDEFLAVLSHELRTPLNPILGWTQLLRSKKFNQQATDKALETIERNAKLQTQLIEDLLDISRILRGKMTLNVTPVSLKNVILAAIETVALAAEAKGIKIQTQFPKQNEFIAGDRTRLQQIVWNLLSNSIKFTPTGGRVEVLLQWFDSYAQIQIMDNGQGIHSDFLPYVFESFRQSDSTMTRKFGGLGLGLTIVRHLVELHGGTVQAESFGEGKGATFSVRLPRMAANPQISPEIEPFASNFDLKGLKVLVVDDEADMRDLIAVILEQYGVEVRVAASAQEAISILDEFQPDILIGDIGMPEMDGYTLLRQIRSRSPEQGGQIPAIALSAYAGEYNRKQALAAGFQMHLSKPIEPAQLVAAISRLVKPK
jgi:PAS domain S-box-containing protein